MFVLGLEFCVDEKDGRCLGFGGPYVLERRRQGADVYVQYGVVSRSPRLCGRGLPSIYTNVIEYIPWILDNITLWFD